MLLVVLVVVGRWLVVECGGCGAGGVRDGSFIFFLSFSRSLFPDGQTLSGKII